MRFFFLLLVGLWCIIFAIVVREEYTTTAVHSGMQMTKAEPHAYHFMNAGRTTVVKPAGQISLTSKFPPSPADNTSWPPEQLGGDCVWRKTAKSAPAGLPRDWKTSGEWVAVRASRNETVRSPPLLGSRLFVVWSGSATAAILSFAERERPEVNCAVCARLLELDDREDSDDP